MTGQQCHDALMPLSDDRLTSLEVVELKRLVGLLPEDRHLGLGGQKLLGEAVVGGLGFLGVVEWWEASDS